MKKIDYQTSPKSNNDKNVNWRDIFIYYLESGKEKLENLKKDLKK